MSPLMQLLACLVATVAYSALVKLPRRAVLATTLIAGAGYGLFLLLEKNAIAYFLATLLIGVSSEICARLMHRTATLFMTAAIIPLVPGVGLYRTMRYIVEGDEGMAVTTGTETILGLCGIALAMTVSTVIFSRRLPKKHRKTVVEKSEN